VDREGQESLLLSPQMNGERGRCAGEGVYPSKLESQGTSSSQLSNEEEVMSQTQRGDVDGNAVISDQNLVNVEHEGVAWMYVHDENIQS